MLNTLNAAITTSTSKSISTLRATCVAAALTVMAVASASAAPTLINGSLTGPVVNYGPPPSWSGGDATTDDPTHTSYAPLVPNSFATAATVSPDGGSWVGLHASGQIRQTVSGFTVGNSYTLSWYHANFGRTNPAGMYPDTDPGGIKVTANFLDIGTGTLRDLSTGWVEESITFVAAATDLTLAFTGFYTDTDPHGYSYQAIDGIRLTENIVTPPSNNVPEPAALSLFSGAGLAMLLAGRRRKQAKQAA